jgi:hypothetical protein
LVDVAAQAYAGGKIRSADLTGREFISLLKELRLIFLRDAAILQPIYLDLPLWRLPIFRDSEWHSFAEVVRHCQGTEEEPADVRMRAVVPAIAEVVHGAINRVSTLLVDTRAIMADWSGIAGKDFHRWMPKRFSKNLRLPHVYSTTSVEKPDLPPSGSDPTSPSSNAKTL